MGYSPENNPYVPGDPYSYDLKWMVDKMKQWTDPLDSADRAKASEDAAKASELNSEAWAIGTINGEAVTPDFPQYQNSSKYWSNRAEALVTDVEDIQEEVRNDLIAQNNNISVLQGRMDAFSSLTEGSTTGDAELMDIRVSADGVIYPNAGDAVRSQISNIDNRFLVIPNTVNILDQTKCIDGYLNASGQITPGTDWKTTPFIKVSDYSHIWSSGLALATQTRVPLDMYFFSTYDDSQTFISQMADGPTHSAISAAVKYIRYSYHPSLYDNLMLRYDGNYYNNFVPYQAKYLLDPCDYVTQKQVDDTISDIAYKPYRPIATTIIDGKLLLVNGNIIDQAGYSVTDYIDVSSYKNVKITGASNYDNAIANFYDENHLFIINALAAASGSANTIYTDKLVNVPPTAKYLVVSGKDITIPEVTGQTTFELKGKWTGKKWIVFGDSITDDRNVKATKRYYDYVRDVTDISIINAGVSGSGYCKDGEPAFGPDTNWHDRILTYGNVDFDVITFFGSFNDMSAGLPNGDITDSGTATKAGCINTTFDNLFSIKPLAIVGVVTPTPWQYATPADPYSEAYVQLLIDICKYRGIPCLDMFHESLLRPWDATFRSLAYSHDGGGGTHPDETGHAMIAPRFEAFLDKLLLS